MSEIATFTIEMAAPPDDVDTVHELLETNWPAAGIVGDLDRLSFETALVELAGNAFRHGDSGSGIATTLTVSIFDDRIEAELIDDGVGGDFGSLDTRMPDELAESGRGMPLIEMLVDEFRYERRGESNIWHITRRLTQQ